MHEDGLDYNKMFQGLRDVAGEPEEWDLKCPICSARLDYIAGNYAFGEVFNCPVCRIDIILAERSEGKGADVT